ncbi:MAG: hypothetical protein U9R52_04965 [Candidatus Omnitrophota bacterium]|nr:hypothetical protein [Candidatus Omnitrophota bacterium]
MKKSKALIFIISAAFFLVSPVCAFSQQVNSARVEKNRENYIVIKSSYAVIRADKEVDLKKAVKKVNVNFARYDPVESKIFLDKGVSAAARFANKVDIIVRKAKKILDMHPHGFQVNIRLYKNHRKLRNAYEEIFKERKDYIAFYIHKFRTVYISMEHISESVLAHEIGHAIIDSYFGILPPHKIRELLACYVDVHLKD